MLDTLVTAYLKAVEAGHQPDQAEWLARYPDLADELAEFFAAQKSIDRAAAPFRGLDPAQVNPRESPTRSAEEAAAKAGSPLANDAPFIAPSSTTDQHGNIGLGTIRYFGDYELLEEIARGGMGVVYKARQAWGLNRAVALEEHRQACWPRHGGSVERHSTERPRQPPTSIIQTSCRSLKSANITANTISA